LRPRPKARRSSSRKADIIVPIGIRIMTARSSSSRSTDATTEEARTVDEARRGDNALGFARFGAGLRPFWRLGFARLLPLGFWPACCRWASPARAPDTAANLTTAPDSAFIRRPDPPARQRARRHLHSPCDFDMDSPAQRPRSVRNACALSGLLGDSS